MFLPKRKDTHTLFDMEYYKRAQERYSDGFIDVGAVYHDDYSEEKLSNLDESLGDSGCYVDILNTEKKIFEAVLKDTIHSGYTCGVQEDNIKAIIKQADNIAKLCSHFKPYTNEEEDCGRVCLGLVKQYHYFEFGKDKLWNMSKEDVIKELIDTMVKEFPTFDKTGKQEPFTFQWINYHDSNAERSALFCSCMHVCQIKDSFRTNMGKCISSYNKSLKDRGGKFCDTSIKHFWLGNLEIEEAANTSMSPKQKFMVGNILVDILSETVSKNYYNFIDERKYNIDIIVEQINGFEEYLRVVKLFKYQKFSKFMIFKDSYQGKSLLNEVFYNGKESIMELFETLSKSYIPEHELFTENIFEGNSSEVYLNIY